ncbi:MAG TPA: histidine phosphatase family protein [Anaerolineales bacterium]
MNHLYLIRHGENLANLTKEFSYKKVDYSLTPKGELQARQTAQYFLDKDIDAIYTSPLKRAYETAGIIAAPLSLHVTVVENFREVNVGELEGQPPTAALWEQHNAIIANWINGHPETAFPGGENLIMLRRRMRAGIEQILAGVDGQSIIIVGHGGLFWLTLQDLCPQVDMGALGHENNNGSITEVLMERDPAGCLSGRLLKWAAFDHLSGLAAELVSGGPKPGELEKR